MSGKKKRLGGQELIMRTNLRLQETAQRLFMAKQELEKKNKELKIAQEREKHRQKELERELSTLKRLARLPAAPVKGRALYQAGRVGAIRGKKVGHCPRENLTQSMAEDLSLAYIHLLESYVKTKDLDKDESLAEELCLKLIECGVTPKGIISMHLKAVPQIKTIGDLETKRVTFESRMVLLKVMTNYASLLREKLGF